MQTFEEFFKLFCECDGGNVAAPGGALGDYSYNDYAPGDTRIPKSLFTTVKRRKKTKKHGKKTTEHRIARR